MIGFEKLENIPEIGIEKKELNDINLDACVSLALEESVINADHTLVTSITTSGGELLKDNIFLEDMPGLDGGYANLDNPIYETISQISLFDSFNHEYKRKYFCRGKSKRSPTGYDPRTHSRHFQANSSGSLHLHRKTTYRSDK